MEEDREDFKLYHEPCFDSRAYLNDYFSTDTDILLQEETVIFPMIQIHKALLTGRICGAILIDISLGPMFHHLLPVCNFFKEIIILELNEACIQEMEKWLKTETEAFDWSHATRFLAEFSGNSIVCLEQEKMLKSKINRILSCDLKKENSTDPVMLPSADCLLCGGALDVMSKDRESYCLYLKKISMLLKPGGYLMLFGGFNACFYKVGDHTFHVLTYDEPFIRHTLADEGYTIDCLETIERKADSPMLDAQHIVFILAIKARGAQEIKCPLGLLS